MARGGALPALARSIGRVDGALATVAALAVLAIMLIVVVDVTLRYLLNAPLPWAFDLVGTYLMGIAFFFSLSETLRRDHHVNVDLLYQRFPMRAKRACKLVAWLLTGLLFAVVTGLAAKAAWARYVNQDVVAGAIAWPTWIPAAVGAIGMGVMTARLLVGVVALVLALVTGRRLDPALAGRDVATPAEGA